MWINKYPPSISGWYIISYKYNSEGMAAYFDEHVFHVPSYITGELEERILQIKDIEAWRHMPNRCTVPEWNGNSPLSFQQVMSAKLHCNTRGDCEGCVLNGNCSSVNMKNEVNEWLEYALDKLAGRDLMALSREEWIEIVGQ